MALPGRSSFAHPALRPRLIALLCTRLSCHVQGTDERCCRRYPTTGLQRHTQLPLQTQRLHVSHSCQAAPTFEHIREASPRPRASSEPSSALHSMLSHEQRLRAALDFAMCRCVPYTILAVSARTTGGLQPRTFRQIVLFRFLVSGAQCLMQVSLHCKTPVPPP